MLTTARATVTLRIEARGRPVPLCDRVRTAPRGLRRLAYRNPCGRAAGPPPGARGGVGPARRSAPGLATRGRGVTGHPERARGRCLRSRGMPRPDGGAHVAPRCAAKRQDGAPIGSRGGGGRPLPARIGAPAVSGVRKCSRRAVNVPTIRARRSASVATLRALGWVGGRQLRFPNLNWWVPAWCPQGGARRGSGRGRLRSPAAPAILIHELDGVVGSCRSGELHVRVPVQTDQPDRLPAAVPQDQPPRPGQATSVTFRGGELWWESIPSGRDDALVMAT
jgi:hypothetical protein